ncbi:hypothetical protein L228DRAFT_286106 [Xylona heveae TC161]|uniref:DUF7924 domain-containing protein n=1 Tax=Xylona heveae (strain CBS 132557 / TC161) TaxID=1328760 RepID=A0A164ZLU7_XYLHT|nr:hypothetical protein L228DRAFT_286106 [Xylona heveae TC161]KZF19256.1 hypothetical protein L228DRAFT_286106 [Xylona heveae TC161]
MSHLFTRKIITPSRGRKRLKSGHAVPNNQDGRRPSEAKSIAYRDANYEEWLQVHAGFYMIEHALRISEKSENLCNKLLETKHMPPTRTIFSDETFEEACQRLQGKNEARIVQDIARLLVPSADALATFSDTRFEVLVESVDEGWSNSIQVTNPRPQPDYAVGFRETAFTPEQLKKLKPALGHPLYQSHFMATYYMCFPFLTSEAKCGTAGLGLADRQNAHSMTLAVRGIVELFKLAKRENELNREILTFSVSHDDRAVMLYGYYPIINESQFTIHRHLIRSFDIQDLDGKEKWTAYGFTIEVYNESLNLLDKLRSVIDELPPDFTLEQTQPAPSDEDSQPSASDELPERASKKRKVAE